MAHNPLGKPTAVVKVPIPRVVNGLALVMKFIRYIDVYRLVIVSRSLANTPIPYILLTSLQTQLRRELRAIGIFHDVDLP